MSKAYVIKGTVGYVAKIESWTNPIGEKGFSFRTTGNLWEARRFATRKAAQAAIDKREVSLFWRVVTVRFAPCWHEVRP